MPGPKLETEAQKVLADALKRVGLTRAQACERLGISTSTLVTWGNGTRQPWRDDLLRLTTLLDEPQLLNVIPSRVGGTIELVCPQCGSRRTVRGNAAKQRLGKLPAGSITIDWDTCTGVELCRKCFGRMQTQQIRKRAQKKYGRAWRNMAHEKGVEFSSTAASREGRKKGVRISAQRQKGHPKPESMRSRLALSSLSPTPRSALTLCLVCHKLIIVAPAGRSQGLREGYRTGLFHQACYGEWCSSTTMRRWKAVAATERRRGRPIPSMPLPLRPRGRQPSTEDLAVMYETTVRYYWQKLGCKHALRDEIGWLLGVDDLAKSMGVARSGLYARVDSFMDLLPDERVARSYIARLRATLMAARDASQRE